MKSRKLRGLHTPGKLLATALLVFFWIAGSAKPELTAAATYPPRIILFIGDGMGAGQRTAAQWSAEGLEGQLTMDALPFQGMSGTTNIEGAITDSAAAGTALAAGSKTANGVISMDPTGTLTLTTILERAQDAGLAVGLVTNTPMAHATPAVFAAHVPDRSEMTEIACQMLALQVDVLLGGGEDDFLPPEVTGHYPGSGNRSLDNRNLISEAVASGYTYVWDAASLSAVDPGATRRLLGLFGDAGMTRPFSPTLATMTQTAVDILSQDPDGFFLMVEGGQIDWACHANDAANTISDTLGFDEAVSIGLNYAEQTGNVLVIVTADHETGGMQPTLEPTHAADEDGPFSMPGWTPFYVNWSSTHHTADPVPTTASGPWSWRLSGDYENTYIHEVMRLALEKPAWITYLPLVLRSAL